MGQMVHTQQLIMVPSYVPQAQLTTQNQVQLVSQGNAQNPLQLVNQDSGQHQVQLVNQETSDQHQVQLVEKAGAGQVQLADQGQSDQVKLVNQVGSQVNEQTMVNNVPMQLSILHPVSSSVNLSEAQTSSPANAVTQTPNLVSGKTGSATVNSMGNLSNLVSNGTPTTVKLQMHGQGGNILLPQQQQQFTSIKQGSVVKQQQVTVRPVQQSPVLVQGQQLVRKFSNNPNITINPVNQRVNKTLIASPSPND